MISRILILSLLSALLFCVGCGSSNNKAAPDGPADTDNDGVIDSADNCPEQANPDQSDADENSTGDACESSYAFSDTSDQDTVSYTGQTARQIIIEDLVRSMLSMSRADQRTKEAIIAEDLNRYYENVDTEGQEVGAALDDQPIAFSLSGTGMLITNTTDETDMTLGSISTGKNLKGKIAGNDKCYHILSDGENEVACDGERVRGEFIGWEFGLNQDALVRTPDDLIQLWFGLLADEAAKDTETLIDTVGGLVPVDSVYINSLGHDFRQLIQKFLVGAVNFSQGAADYLQIDFGSEANLTLADDKAYTEGQHDYDEAFGYYGAARNAHAYKDIEARGGNSVDVEGVREAFQYGYNDIDGDGKINIRSEVMLGTSTNCAKRDLGATVATNYTSEAFEAFIAGRKIVQDAGDAGMLTDDQRTMLDSYIKIAAQTWEKCIAATVVHYINDTIGDMGNFVGDQFADLANYKDLSKHWGEMKGFALGLQFSPESPFRLGENGASVADLKAVLAYMGDAPVLADGTQLGTAYMGMDGDGLTEASTAAERVSAYRTNLLKARDKLMMAYDFNQQNVENW